MRRYAREDEIWKNQFSSVLSRDLIEEIYKAFLCTASA